MQLEDCSAAASEAFIANLAPTLGLDPSQISLDCNYAGSDFTDDGTRRSLLTTEGRKLMQARSKHTSRNRKRADHQKLIIIKKYISCLGVCI